MAVLGLESRWKTHDIPTILPLIKLANVGHVKGGKIIIIVNNNDDDNYYYYYTRRKPELFLLISLQQGNLFEKV